MKAINLFLYFFKKVTTDPKNIEYKIDIPANRYDLLCVEGIATALAVFINKFVKNNLNFLVEDA
jgi:hypothetical protein